MPDPATIRRVRLAAGLTQTAAAVLIGRSMRVWQAYEAGDRGIDPLLWRVWRIRAGLDSAESILIL